jgi:hypothetical protein
MTDTQAKDLAAKLGAINWAALFAALVADAPAIIALITTLIPLFAAPAPVAPPAPLTPVN